MCDETARIRKLCKAGKWKELLNEVRQDPKLGTTVLPDQNPKNRTTILHQATQYKKGSEEDRAQLIKLIVSQTPKAAKIATGYNCLPLHCILQPAASLQDKESLIRQLVEANPDALTYRGGPLDRTPLHVLCTGTLPVAITQFMVQKGKGACFVADKRGFLPAHVACRYHCSVQKLELLLGVNPNALFAKTKDGSTLLSLAESSVGPLRGNVELINHIKKALVGTEASLTNNALENESSDSQPSPSSASAQVNEDQDSTATTCDYPPDGIARERDTLLPDAESEYLSDDEVESATSSNELGTNPGISGELVKEEDERLEPEKQHFRDRSVSQLEENHRHRKKNRVEEGLQPTAQMQATLPQLVPSASPIISHTLNANHVLNTRPEISPDLSSSKRRRHQCFPKVEDDQQNKVQRIQLMEEGPAVVPPTPLSAEEAAVDLTQDNGYEEEDRKPPPSGISNSFLSRARVAVSSLLSRVSGVADVQSSPNIPRLVTPPTNHVPNAADSIFPLVAVLRNHSNDSGMVTSVCRAILDSCLKQEECLQALEDARGIEVISSTLQEHWTNLPVRDGILRTLCGLSEAAGGGQHVENK